MSVLRTSTLLTVSLCRLSNHNVLVGSRHRFYSLVAIVYTLHQLNSKVSIMISIVHHRAIIGKIQIQIHGQEAL